MELRHAGGTAGTAALRAHLRRSPRQDSGQDALWKGPVDMLERNAALSREPRDVRPQPVDQDQAQEGSDGAPQGRPVTKLIREVTVAARNGRATRTTTPGSAPPVLAAREANMPADNITRAIKKGTGELEGVNYDELTYEGYGRRVAFVLEILTDTRTGRRRRCAPSSPRGRSMAASGAVAFQFERKGVVPVKKGASETR